MLLIFCDCCLHACRDKEVLLFQTQFFPGIVLVSRIKHLYDILRQVLLLNSLHVITLVKGVKLEVVDSFRIPYTQGIYNSISITDDWNIKRHSAYRLVILLNKRIFSGCRIVLYVHISAKFYFLCIFRTAQLKRIAVFQPVIRNLYLITIFNFLLKHTVAVTNPAAVCTISQSRQRIQETCRKSSQTAVSERRIRLLILDHIQIQSQLLQCLFYFIIFTKIDQIVSKSTPHQELHRHIVNDLRIVLLILFLSCQPVVDDRILHCIGNGLKNLLLCRLFQIFTVKCFYIVFDFCDEFLLVKLLLHFRILLSGCHPPNHIRHICS